MQTCAQNFEQDADAVVSADAVYRKAVVTASNEKLRSGCHRRQPTTDGRRRLQRITKERLSPPPTNYRKAVVTASNEKLRSGCHRRQPTTEQRGRHRLQRTTKERLSPPPINYRSAVVTASNEQLRSGCHRRQSTTETRSSPRWRNCGSHRGAFVFRLAFY